MYLHEIIKEEALDCPDCDNIGWYFVGNSLYPDQEQCSFCYCEENSKFALSFKIKENIEIINESYARMGHEKITSDILNHLMGSIIKSIENLQLLQQFCKSEQAWILKNTYFLLEPLKIIAGQSDTIDNHTLIKIIPILSILHNCPQNDEHTLNKKEMENTIYNIMSHMYGTTFHKLYALASSFQLQYNIDYWNACLINPTLRHQKIELPTL